MTPEERQMLTDFANKIAQTPSPAHDPEAEEFIRAHIGTRPDALYLLTQTVLVQSMAIEHAQQEIQQLQQKMAQQAPAAPGPGQGSFLGRGGGWGAQPGAPQQPGYATPQPGYQPPQPQYQQPAPSYQSPAPGYQQPPYNPPVAPGPSGMGSFLRTAGGTVAGVAAGALAFEGIKSMFGGVGHLFGIGQPGGGYFGGSPGRETVVNNYYDQPGGGSSVDLGPSDSTRYDDTDPGSRFVDNSSDDTSQDDSSSADDSSYDDSDSSSGDDQS